MYADDVVIVGADDELETATEVLKQWSEERNMLINKAKSGILPIEGSRLSVGGALNGYPVVETYKYLGVMLSGRLDVKEHCKLINRKAAFISGRLFGVRLKDDLRTNMNLFKVLIMPSYRMAYTLYPRLS